MNIIAGREPNLDWFNDKENKPLEPTARPLEGVKTTEPIPTPELTTLRPLEKAVDTDKPQPLSILNVNYMMKIIPNQQEWIGP